MNDQGWSWLLTIVGVTGFILAGRKVWWAWYVNLGCQGLWFVYALVTEQYGFVVAACVYTVVFTQNAVRWTRERNQSRQQPESQPENEYRCIYCGKHVLRYSDKQWIKSYCDATGKNGRLRKVS